MKARYDFHLHSCLSPCADNDMTPCNIANMAALLGLDIIALTDHNSCGNCRAAESACKSAGVAFVPGMELCTAEEVHLVCLFPDCAAAEAFSDYIKTTLPPIKNKPAVFGEQIYMYENDKPAGTEPVLLVTASGVSAGGAPELMKQYGGICYPAHIDRPSFSILSNLGGFPPDSGLRCAELGPNADLPALLRANPALRDMRVMRSSDAHRLEDMREAADTLELAALSARAVLEVIENRSLPAL